MTKREASIVTAYTGYFIGSFDDSHAYIEEIMQRPVFTHELASKKIADEIRLRSEKDFVALIVKD